MIGIILLVLLIGNLALIWQSEEEIVTDDKEIIVWFRSIMPFEKEFIKVVYETFKPNLSELGEEEELHIISGEPWWNDTCPDGKRGRYCK